MAKVEWSAGIDSVSGALSKPSKSGQHSCSKMLLGTHRVAATTSSDCNRLFLRKKTNSQERPEPCSRGSGGVQCAEGHRRRIQDHASVSVARLCRRDQRLTESLRC